MKNGLSCAAGASAGPLGIALGDSRDTYMCMFVYIYIYIMIIINIHICINYIYIYIHTCITIYIYRCIHIYIYIHTHMYIGKASSLTARHKEADLASLERLDKRGLDKRE